MSFNTIKNIKCLEINLTKDVKDPYNTNYKISLKETCKGLNTKRKIPGSHGFKDLTFAQMPILDND